MNTFAAVLVAITAVAVFGGASASPFTAAVTIASGAAILIIAQRNAGNPDPTSRVMYLIATVAYIIALPWLHQNLIPHHAAAPAPLAWTIPIIYLIAIPFALPLLPLISRVSYGAELYRYARRVRR